MDAGGWLSLHSSAATNIRIYFQSGRRERAAGWWRSLPMKMPRALIVRDVEHRGLRVLEITREQEFFGEDQIDEMDNHLAANFRDIEPGKRTVWGTIQCYKGEGEA